MRGYHFLRTSIGVTSDLASATAWLDEFLCPAFDPWHGDDPDYVVRIVSDRGVYETVAASRPPEPLQSAPSFALDQEVVSLPSWTTSDRVVLADERRGAFYVLAGAHVDVVVRPDSTRLRVGVMRVIREIATAGARASADHVQLHTAALEMDGRGVLLAGPKGAGKTTVLGYLTSSTGARILTNDRAFLRARSGDRFAVHGVPTIVSVRPGTVALLPRLTLGIAAVERPAHLSSAEHRAAFAEYGQADASAALKLSPPQLAQQLGVSLAASAPLAAIAFPATHRDPHRFTIERLALLEARDHLRTAIFGCDSGSASAIATAFERFTCTRRPPSADDALIGIVAAHVPCFALRIGAGCFTEPSKAAEILSRLPVR